MGGYGSGRRGSGRAATTSEVKRVDIRYIRKQGWLYSGRKGFLSWQCRGETSGTVGYSISGDVFTLDYSVRQHGEEWEAITLEVPLTTTSCRYGGQRYYFQCRGLGCGRRCEVIYSTGKYFVCRKCAGLLYTTQKSDRLDQIRIAKDKIGERIFEEYDGEWGWPKKKGIHQKTFERGYARFLELEEQWSREYMSRAKALGMKL